MPGGDGERLDIMVNAERTKEAEGRSQTPAIEGVSDHSASRVTTNLPNAFLQDGPLPGDG